MSLKTFHLVFIVLAMIAADMFGAWAIWHRAIIDSLTLGLGLAALAVGLALGLYAFFFVREMERAHIG